MTTSNSSKSINASPSYLDSDLTQPSPAPTMVRFDSEENRRSEALIKVLKRRVADLQEQAEILKQFTGGEYSHSSPTWELDAYRALFDSLAAGTISR